MDFGECLDGFEEKCEDICDLNERCEVCGGFMNDAMGMSLKKNHLDCRRILAIEKNGCMD